MLSRLRATTSLAARACSSGSSIGARLRMSRNYAAKEVRFDEHARRSGLKDIEELADAVKVTMGPWGRNVVIEQSFGPPPVTKNLGASLVKQVANSTNDIAGNGTTCARVLTRAILIEVVRSGGVGMNAMDVQRGIDMAVHAAVNYLKSRARMITTSEEIVQVATIAANGEKEIGALIAKAIEKVGTEGVITIQDGKTLYDELEVVEGMKLDWGYIAPYFITSPKTQECELDEPLVLIHENKITSVNAIVKVLELALKRRKPLLIVAEDVDSEALATLIFKKVCVVKAPGFGESRKAYLQDLATLTGGQVISEELGMNMKKVDLDVLGSCKKATVSKDDTVILDGGGDKKSIKESCEKIRAAIEAATSDDDKERLEERLAKLSGRVAVLKIGGASEAEVGEKKDRVTNALNATKAAVAEGILPGGGVALLYASKELDKLQTANYDQKVGVQIIQVALKTPVYTIASNAGAEGALVVGKLLVQDDPGLGYDAAKGEYVNMVKAGIIDPLKGIRTALVDAASVASSLMITEADAVEAPKDEKDNAPAMGGISGGNPAYYKHGICHPGLKVDDMDLAGKQADISAKECPTKPIECPLPHLCSTCLLKVVRPLKEQNAFLSTDVAMNEKPLDITNPIITGIPGLGMAKYIASQWLTAHQTFITLLPLALAFWGDVLQGYESEMERIALEGIDWSAYFDSFF